MTAGHTSTLFAEASRRAPIALPLKDEFYGMREFAVYDPDGYLVTFAQQRQ